MESVMHTARYTLIHSTATHVTREQYVVFFIHFIRETTILFKILNQKLLKEIYCDTILFKKNIFRKRNCSLFYNAMNIESKKFACLRMYILN